MKKILTLALAAVLLTGCQLSLSAEANPGEDPGSIKNTAPSYSIPSSHTSEEGTASTGGSGTSPVSTTKPVYPSKGLLSDPAEYAPGNPKTHSPAPVLPDYGSLKDKTGETFEKYRSVFLEYLHQVYPEHSFRLVNIMNYQEDGKTYKEATAYSENSRDIIMKLYYDGETMRDTFQRDVVGRMNSMNRWRRSFRTHMDEVSKEIVQLSRVCLDVSYDYYGENISKIILDSPLDPVSTEYKKCLEMYFEKGFMDAEKVADTASKIYGAMSLKPYRFDEYFIYLEDFDGTRTAFQIPPRLINSSLFVPEMVKALQSDSLENIIQRVPAP